jgi:hypothetical protein
MKLPGQSACGHEFGCDHLSTDTTVSYAPCNACGGMVCSGCNKVRDYFNAKGCFLVHSNYSCACPSSTPTAAPCDSCGGIICQACHRLIEAP